MQPIYDPQAAKRSANLSVNGDLLGKARELNINLKPVKGLYRQQAFEC